MKVPPRMAGSGEGSDKELMTMLFGRIEILTNKDTFYYHRRLKEERMDITAFIIQPMGANSIVNRHQSTSWPI